MERRAVIKNLGLMLGASVATPSMISILQSCKSEPKVVWTPEFFTKEQGDALMKLVDIILPKTDTPSASEVQVHSFIDRFLNEILPTEEQEVFRMFTGKFMDKVYTDSGKTAEDELETAELEAVLAEALDVTPEQAKEKQEALEEYFTAVAEGGEANLPDELARYAFANNLRDLSIWSYKTSEYIAEEVLAYLPLPGGYVACGDVNELSGGRAWSLERY